MPPGTVWTQLEDDLLRNLVEKLGEKKWAQISHHIGSKTSKQCRRRWMNHLNMETKKCGWSIEEDGLLLELHKVYGNKWTVIAKKIGGRTDNAVKNRYYVLLRRDERSKTSSAGSLSTSSSELDEEPCQWNGDSLQWNDSMEEHNQYFVQKNSLENFREQQKNMGFEHNEEAIMHMCAMDNPEMTRSNSKRSDLAITIPDDGTQSSAVRMPNAMGQILVQQEVLSPVEKKLVLEMNEMENLPLHISLVGAQREPAAMEFTQLLQPGVSAVNGFPPSTGMISAPACMPGSENGCSNDGRNVDSLLDILRTACSPKLPLNFNSSPGKMEIDGFVSGETADDPYQGLLNDDHIKLLTKLFTEAKKPMDEYLPTTQAPPPGGPFASELQQEPRCSNSTSEGMSFRMPQTSLASPFSGHMPASLLSPSAVQLSPIFSQVELETLISALSPTTSFPSEELLEFMNATSQAGGGKLMKQYMEMDG